MRVLKFASFLAVLGFSLAAKANSITNPDFGPANPDPGYGAIAGWTESPYPSTLGGLPYLAGSNTSVGPFWDNGDTGGPTTVGFIQVYSGSSINSLSQTLGLIAGYTYSYSYLENARTGSAPIVETFIGGATLVAAHTATAVGGSNPFHLYSGTFVATSASEDLTFTVSQALASDDATALFTQVNVTAITPEPSSLMLLGTGLAGVLGCARRRFFTA